MDKDSAENYIPDAEKEMKSVIETPLQIQTAAVVSKKYPITTWQFINACTNLAYIQHLVHEKSAGNGRVPKQFLEKEYSCEHFKGTYFPPSGF